MKKKKLNSYYKQAKCSRTAKINKKRNDTKLNDSKNRAIILSLYK